MSTITVTPLVAGDTARSADVNATLTSWNAGSAAGQIGAENVRVEGIDRRTMSAAEHVVGSASVGSNTITTIGATLAQRSTGVWAGVPLLGCGTVVFGAERYGILHAHIDFRSASLGAGNPRLQVLFRIEYSENYGPFTTVVGSVQRFRMRDTGVLCSRTAPPSIPGLLGSATWSVRVGGSILNTYQFRVAFQTNFDGASAGGVDPDFLAGTIFLENLGA